MNDGTITRLEEKILLAYDEHCKSISLRSGQGLDSNESPADRRKTRKAKEKEYIEWFEWMFPDYAKVKSAWFHKKLAKILIENDVCDLLAEIYRSGAKSVHLDLGIPMYLYVTDRMKFMLLIGQTDLKAKKLISDIQAELMYNKKFIHYYGKKFKFGDWSDGDFTTTDGVKFMAMSPGQSPRGLREGNQRPDYIIIDDVDTKQRCNNDLLSDKLLEWAWEDLRGTFDEGSKFRRFVVANNNFHKNTLINKLKDEFKIYAKKVKEFGYKKKHFVVTVTAVRDLISFEPNWPEKTSAEYWKEKYHTTPYRSFMREYMHTHILEGTIFKNNQIQFKKRLRYDQYDALGFYGDLSYKDAGDYKGMFFTGKKGREFHHLDIFLRKTSRYNVAKWLYEKVSSENLLKYNIQYWIEGLFAQDDFVNDFDIVGDELGWYIPVVADKKPKIGKFDRIESMAGYYERGNIWYNESLKESTDFNTHKDQLLAFQKGSGANNDGPDAEQSNISKLNIQAIYNSVPPKITTRREMINNKKNRF